MAAANEEGKGLWGLRVTLSIALAWGMVLADYRYGNITSELRSQISSAIVVPARLLAELPTAAWTTSSDYLKTREELIEAKIQLEEELLRERTRHNLLRQIETENLNLRRLVDARQRIDPEAIVAEIVNTASLPFINRIVLNKGSRQGVSAGQGVFNDEGVVGQLTRVDSDSSQALLLTDKRFWVATRLRRDGNLVLLQGDGGGKLRIRFVPADVELEKGDILVTAGGAGPFPAGLPVAVVDATWQPDGIPFQEGSVTPLASIRQDSAVLVHNSEEILPLGTELPVQRSGAVPAAFDPQPLP